MTRVAAEAPITVSPHVLREYALIADGERGALVGPRGDISWLCLPRWHDDPVFSDLLGGPGAYTVTPTARFVWGGYYEQGSLIWRSRWVVEDGAVIECREALARPAGPRTAVVLRRVQAVSGTARVTVALDVRAGAGRQTVRDLHRAERWWTGRSGPLRWRWSGAPQARPDGDGVLRTDLEVAQGDAVDLVLEIGPDEPGRAPDPDRLWSETTTSWSESVPELSTGSANRDAEHAYAVLRGLTSGSGGMVAAATTGLPERAERHNSYDYRYVWIRDQAYAGLAAAAHGLLPAVDDAVRFATARLLEDGDRICPAYRVDGGPVPGVRDLDLPGYPGGTAVAGNRINDQFQLDSVGELLQLFAAAAALDRLDADGWSAARLAVDVVAKRWDEPEAGIWELHDDWWTQSRLAVVAGLRRIAEVSPGPGDAGRAETLADGILAEAGRRCLHPQGWWQRSPTAGDVDASLLLPPVRGALPAGDPRTRATLAAVRDQLTEDGYVYRFRPDPAPLGEQEGAFLLCGFALALAEHAAGDAVAAARAFERTRAACGPPGLLSEEFDVRQRQLRGNLPQAFVHALLLECAAVLP
ncbi:glycoside hydrolase family 15 protein [Blastococcus tunisiensis]|uniref:Glucoamylase (Glucan-1,4-alpha-glucosidase), GH15 family n=1 Tax=Blastococcus tunisiensis TaxID=1798228 RepID=A0A1I2DT88_9ACTN|nr:glycoside hydrolase family 15 protein [Blastococcus sp. DSM 46838]SFE83608.1 Glucoamylase (glucan-1,4-alpha-glucosidase), GH15 family [Blastococcus sp. DSM 46838]